MSATSFRKAIPRAFRIPHPRSTTTTVTFCSPMASPGCFRTRIFTTPRPTTAASGIRRPTRQKSKKARTRRGFSTRTLSPTVNSLAGATLRRAPTHGSRRAARRKRTASAGRRRDLLSVSPSTGLIHTIKVMGGVRHGPSSVWPLDLGKVSVLQF